MVFESIVADLLNRFLGDFVDNLDSSQLNIGIWGGDIKLDNLEVKETALDELDLPVKLRFGYLSSLVLKIPWKNLYNEPVIATIDGLNLIVVPNKGVVYNADKAKKNELDVKQKTLARLEEARKNRRKPADPQADSFAEKMVTQIIKNLQVKISNIHVRFEDKYTNRHRPFAMGITLEKLNFETTDENWKATIHKETVKIIHKLVSLDNLAVYWNSDSKLFSDLTDKAEIRRKMKETIHNGNNKPIGYKYMLEPIKLEAKLKLNQKPETDGTDWRTPKIDLGVDMQKLALAVAKFQYQDVLLFLEAQERFTLAGQYLKYRPNLNEYRGHYRTWWKFAYTSILEEKVRRRRNNWSWERMKAHRKLCKEYRDAWVKHQTEKSLSTTTTELIKKAEEKLDVFNVNVARQQAEMEIDRKRLTRLEDQPQGWVAWGKSWFGGGGGAAPPADASKGGKDIAAKFQEAMTPEEKAKLFEAIDYQENIPPTNYPKHYVENKFEFRLGEVAVVVEGALSMQMLHIAAAVQQRPSANALNVHSSIQELRMDGCGAEMLRVRDPSQPWLDLLLDTHPLDGKYDQLVRLGIAPVNLKYHAPAVNNALEVFKPPESVRLNQLTTLAMSRYEEVKTRSVTGLAHAVENRSKLVLDIKVQPATVMISEGGVYSVDKPTVVADLGLLTLSTVEEKDSTPTSTLTGTMDEKLQVLMEKAYDKFRFRLSNVVVCMAEDVKTALGSVTVADSPLHILKPTGLDIQLHKSSIDDLRLPKLRVVGDLPDIVVAISDRRLLMLLQLLNSIPKPESEPEVIVEEVAPVKTGASVKDRAKMKTIMEVNEIDAIADDEEKESEDKKKAKTSEQQVQVELDLRLNEIGLVLYKEDAVLVELAISKMGAKLQMRTFDLVVTAEVGALTIEMPQFKSFDAHRKHLYLIDNDGKDEALIRMRFVQANPESPFFATEYKKTEQAVDFQFSSLNVSMHQQALMELKRFGEELQAKMADINRKLEEKIEQEVEKRTRKLSHALSQSVASLAQMTKESQSEAAAERRKARKERKMVEEDPNVIKMRVDASVGSLAVKIGTESSLDTVMAIRNVNADVEMTTRATVVNATLQTICMDDMTPGALYKHLMAVEGDEDMLKFGMTQFNRTDAEKKAMVATDVDMKVKVRLAQMRFVFLNIWLVRLMGWLAPFQEEAAKAAQAAQAAAKDKAAEAAENVKTMLEQSPPRIELDVELKAPILLLPRASDSRDVIVLILGVLAVNNKIHGDRQNPKAIIDKMNVALTELKFGIGRMDEKASTVDSVCYILKPLSFIIGLQRNLMFAVVKDIPEITVDANIPSIEMDMSEHDYTTIMLTLSGNLAEGKDLEPPVVVAPVAAIDAPPTMSGPPAEADDDEVEERTGKRLDRKVSHSRPGTAKLSTAVRTVPEKAVAASRVVFGFTLDKIVAVLYRGGADTAKREPADAFASMRLAKLKLTGSLKEDNAMSVNITLHAFEMCDERKSETKINQLMDKKPGHEESQFLALKFAQDAKTNKDVKITMSAFFICLCPEFLGCLSRFFTVPQTEEQKERAELEAQQKGSAVAPGAVKSETTAASAAPQQTPGAITFDCNMQGVEVILVENSMEPESTQALILSFNVIAHTKPDKDLQVITGGIEKLAMFSSFYNPARRNEVTYEVLKPLDIKMNISVNPDSKSTDAVLKISPMELHMAPSVIRLLSSVNAEFAKASAAGGEKMVTEGGSSTAVGPKFKRYPSYWDARIIEMKKYWFFQAPEAAEAFDELEDNEEENNADNVSRGSNKSTGKAPLEKARVEIERICFTLEAGQGAVPVPLIYMDMLLSAQATGWSSALRASADVSLQMNYYNEAFSVWEPVIEPVEDGHEKWARWDLKANVRGRNKLNPKDASPVMDVKIEAEKMLNITVTKSFLQLLNKLSEVFAQAAKQISPPTSRHLPGLAPFVVLNDTGILVKVADSEDIRVSENGQAIDATHGAFIDLHMKKPWVQDEILSPDPTELSATLRLELAETVREIKVGRAETVSIPLPKVSDGGKKWRVVAETSIENGRRLVTLTSHVSVHNHLDVDMELYSKRDTTLDLFGVVPAGDKLTLPVPLLFTPTGEIYFKPANDRCEVSVESVTWHCFGTRKRVGIRCDVSEDTTQGYFFETVVEDEKIQEGVDSVSSRYTLHLYHPLDFHNNLPFPVKIEQPTALDVEPGGHVLLNAIAGMKVKLWASYMGERYCLDMKIPEEKKELDVVALNTETGSAELLLGIHWTYDYGALKAYLYAPFWLVNNTDKTLRHMEASGNFITNNTARCVPCRKSVPNNDQIDEYTLKHLPEDNPIILPFPSTDLSKKKKGKVMVDESNFWSDEFPLDTVGSAARITCKGKERDYDITVDIKLCQSALTKIVTFSPFYLVSNLSRFDMQVREHEQQSSWVTVPAEKCVGIWPSSKEKRKLIVARFGGEDLPTEESLAFPITENFETLSKIGGDAVGMDVSVSTGESSVAIHLSSFTPGMAPVLLMNSLKIPLSFGQKGHSKKTIRKNEMAYFTWESIVEERILQLECGDWKSEDKLDQNKFGEVQPDKNKRRFVYMANFLMGRQRTILLTDDVDIAKLAYGGWETDNVDMQCEMTLHGIGLSVVDNVAGKEIIYIGISSSDILWEQEVKKNRWKVFSVKYMEQLEAKYQEHLLDPKNEYLPIDHTQVNLTTMIMKEKKKEVKLRRIFEQGIWANFGKSAQRTRIHFKLNHLQIDNQLDACVFPRVLAVVPPPRSVVQDNAPKPFIEMSILQRQTEFSTVPELEYLRVLVQEFAIQVDQGLLNAILGLIASEVHKKPYGKEMFDEDMKLTKVKLADTALQYKSMRPKMFYNDFHISPLMIHLSFSQGGTTGDAANAEMPIQSEVVTVLLKSVGVSLTELQDVVFKLAYFERRCVFYSPDQLNAEIINHYTMQALKQIYVLVLGLDIIGNPFGLVRDLSAGVEDLFYQPFQGAILGPGEFMSGVSLGVQSMFGHAVGGAAGAVGRITGTVGKGVAALTFDSEYQRKRQEDLNRKPQTFGEGMARAVKGLGTGVVGGITGVVTKPIEGAREGGGLGFVKGVGKGLIGVVTRPVSGVVDFASGTMESVRTVAGAHKEAGALRPPRVIRENRIIRPYSLNEALGYKVFKDTDRGAVAETDEYVTYAPVTQRVVLLVTDRQLVIAKRADVMGTWTADWQMEYSKIHEPQFVKDGIKVLLKEKKKGFLGFGTSDGKIITFQNAESIQQKVLAAYKASLG